MSLLHVRLKFRLLSFASPLAIVELVTFKGRYKSARHRLLQIVKQRKAHHYICYRLHELRRLARVCETLHSEKRP